MKQGLLAFQYEQEKGSTGMTGLSGLLTYVELMDAAGLRSSVERHVRLRERGQGWTDSQIIISLMLLNLAGGESVSDLDLLEKDRGLCRILREFETCGNASQRAQGVGEEMASWASSECAVGVRRCSGTWRCSMTRARRRCGKLTEHSYLLPTELWRVCAR